MKPGRYKTVQTFHFSNNNKEVGFVQNSKLPDSNKQKALFEYHTDKKDESIKKYKILIRVLHPNISCIIGYDWTNTDRIIAYQRTDFSLEAVILKKELFWNTDRRKLNCMTEEYQMFIIRIWSGLVYLHVKRIGFKYEEDFEKIYLVDGKLSEPKFYIMNRVEVTTGRENDLKLSARILKLIILGIQKRHGLQTSHRGLENLEKVLDVISCCRNPRQAVEDHPELCGTLKKIRMMETVYDLLLSGKTKTIAHMEKWFGETRKVKHVHRSWKESLGNSWVKSVFDEKKERYVTQSGDLHIFGLVKLMRDSMHHVSDHVGEEAEVMEDEDIVRFFDSRFPDFFLELHHYIHQLNPARCLM